ncbi:hypothetical protein [Stenoxybacter acetivorans]|uniref:hypothetical protein n=1 Tax=Stenoxybacter acetivorans TaxID=422441 RepID=UPI00068A11E8|nr:hypothetical protein [Stenoxybacter acetivorans]
MSHTELKEKARREGIRWYIISTLHKALPHTTGELFLRDVMQEIYGKDFAVSLTEIRQALKYLEERSLVKLTITPMDSWFADLSVAGVDLAEYTIDCRAGIARPPKYWKD